MATLQARRRLQRPRFFFVLYYFAVTNGLEPSTMVASGFDPEWTNAGPDDPEGAPAVRARAPSAQAEKHAGQNRREGAVGVRFCE